MDARQKELRLKVYIFLLNSAIVFINQLSSGFFPVAAFWAYTMLAGHELRIEIAFPALELFSLLQTNLKDVPQLITVLLNASVALGRIEEYMKEPDRVEEVETSGYDGPLELRHASFAWPGMSKNVLHDVTVTFAPGLSVIYGPVAAGKTALLQALLGELDHKEGELIRADRPVAYCSQTPWLQSMSVRENILFFEPMNEARYKATVSGVGPALLLS
jgi:ABC-type multidrug transport system fused ATPase/permease subunit